MSLFGRILAASLIVLKCSSLSFAAESASSGREIALQWCTSCHVVVEGQVTAFTAIPTFREIAKKYRDRPGALDAFLTAPQHPMPEVNLTRDEIRDLSAYIRSLD